MLPRVGVVPEWAAERDRAERRYGRPTSASRRTASRSFSSEQA